jgi:iron complex outermembrane receptor protein
MNDYTLKAAQLAATAMAGLLVSTWAVSATPATAATTSAETGTLEEVIVTAERRTGTAQRTALALAVVSGEELANAGISQPQDLGKLVPGLRMTNSATTQIYVRGVGDNQNNSLGQSAVAVSTDGVYVGRTTAVAGNFFDLERVEVLKGPQGTLYGRNASGGAINIISNKPTHELGGNAQFELGSYNLRRLTGSVNVPVNDQLAFRLAVSDSKRDGYLTDGRSDEETRSGRLHALWTPNDNVSLLVTVDASKVGGIGDGSAYIGHGLEGSAESSLALSLRPVARVQTLTGSSSIPYLGVAGQKFSNSGARAQLDWNLGFANLTVLPGYRKQTFSYITRDVNGSVQSLGKSDQSSAEVRLGHQSDKLKWSAGLYYFKENVDFTYQGYYTFAYFQAVSFGGPPFSVFSSVNNYFQAPEFGTKSNAVFGETTYSFTDRFRGIVGYRHTEEKRNIDLRTQWYGENYGPGQPFFITGARSGVVHPKTGVLTNLYTYNNLAKLSFGSDTGKVGFEFDVAPDSLLFATVATGFKSGGFSLSPPPQATYEPEKLTAYTLGWKNRLLDNRLQLNGEAFYWDYTNQQISHQAPDINGAQGFITENAGKTKISGADLDIRWAPSANDRLGLQVQYLKTKFDEYSVIVGFPGGGDGCTYTPTVAFGRNVFTKNCAGLAAPYAPETSGTAGYSHTFNAANGGHVVFNASAQFASEQQTDTTTDTHFTVKSYAMYDADLNYEAANKKWIITGYVRNIANKILPYYNTNKGDFAATTFGNLGGTSLVPADLQYKAGVLPPRTYGVRFNIQF